MIGSRFSEISRFQLVSTLNIIAKALSVESSFQDSNHKVLRYWVYPFLALHMFSLRIFTRQYQKFLEHFISARKLFANYSKDKFKQVPYQDVPPTMFFDVGEATVHFEAKSKST